MSRRRRGQPPHAPGPAPERGAMGRVDRAAQALMANELAQAERLCVAHLATTPHDGRALCILGVAQLSQNRPGEAAATLARAQGQLGDVASVLVPLGTALWRSGQPSAAIAPLRQAQGLALGAADRARTGEILAHALADTGYPEAAQAPLDDAVAHGADGAGLDALQGRILAQTGDKAAAYGWFARARERAPDSAAIARLYASAASDNDTPAVAAAAWEDALALAPASPDLRYRCANYQYQAGQLGCAAGHCQALLARQPAHANAWLRLAMVRLAQGLPDASRLALCHGLQRDSTRRDPWETLSFSLHYLRGCPPDVAIAQQQRWMAAFAPRAAPFAAWPGPADSRRRLRVGVLSSAFKNHPVGFFTAPALERLDPGDYELHGLDLAGPAEDLFRRQFRRAMAYWHDLSGVRGDDLLAYLRAQAFDIIIDMSGYMENGAMYVLHDRAAPIQMKWMGGQFSSTGLPAMDYFISDPVGTPPALEGDYTETTIRLAGGYTAYQLYAEMPVPADRPPSHRRGYITLGCFNKWAKVCDDTIALWARILRARPDTRLYLRSGGLDDPSTAAACRARFRAAGVADEQLILGGRLNHVKLLLEYHEVDIALDPLAYSGGLTTCEALVMGVPVVTLPGRLFTQRHAACRLAAAGLSHWIVDDTDAYRATVEALMADPAALLYWRRHLRGRLAASALADGGRNAAELGAALRAAWQRCCQGDTTRVPIDCDARQTPIALSESAGGQASPAPAPDALAAEDVRAAAEAALAAGDWREAGRRVQYLLLLAPDWPAATELADRIGANDAPPEATTPPPV